ncbi:YkvA family protein [Pseudanabaena sp. FACHB-2040]|uniref:YkvA family protein n=1 Tax=Pseudanabaena sp. FACHB-2040 TaxID=2692859 RepID=UPI0016844FA9|nr:YkvA family protein [Pseudanabaena sp. FACHB-2040]MBD2260835.1 DUF1232 domain-containing protein [Pseudanabaena sp. FACHB-2040]
MKNPSQSFYTWYKNTLRNDKYRWLVILGSLAYLISPLDISPDFIPIIGWIDDGVVATLLVAEVSQIAMEFLKKRGRSISTDQAASIDEPAVTVEAR